LFLETIQDWLLKISEMKVRKERRREKKRKREEQGKRKRKEDMWNGGEGGSHEFCLNPAFKVGR